MLSFYLAALDTDEDKSEFEKLYTEHRQTMYKVAFAVLNNPEDSEDAVHKAFVKIADNFSKIKKIPCQEITPYLVIIVRNAAIDIYNKNKQKAEHTAEFYDESTAVDVDYFENIDYDELVKTISQLPQIYKDVLFLRYVNDFSVKEISKMLDISVDTVWKRLERARKMLKELLERR